MTSIDLFNMWFDNYSESVSLFAALTLLACDGLAGCETAAISAMARANRLEVAIADRDGAAAALAKLRVAVISARALEAPGEPPSAEWRMVMSALRDLDRFFPAISASLAGEWETFDVSGGAAAAIG